MVKPIDLILVAAMVCLVQGYGSAGCGKPLPKEESPGGPSHRVNFATAEGAHRVYYIHIPPDYSVHQPAPVIFSFHGRNRTAGDQEALSKFSYGPWNPKAISVYPQGMNEQWQGDPASQGIDDIGFIINLLDHLLNRYCIAPEKVHAAGKSNGGGLAHLLACHPIASRRIAAFATVSGAYYQQVGPGQCDPKTVPIRCQSGRPSIPAIIFHGTGDQIIPYDGGLGRGACLPSVPHVVEEWARRDHLGPTPRITSLFQGKVWKYEYGHNGSLGMVTHYRIVGLGHAWPSTAPNSDNKNGTYLNATPVIMDFFNRWSLGSTADVR